MRRASDGGQRLILVLRRVPRQAQAGYRERWRRVHVVPDDEHGVVVDGDDGVETSSDDGGALADHASLDARLLISGRCPPRLGVLAIVCPRPRPRPPASLLRARFHPTWIIYGRWGLLLCLPSSRNLV